MVQRTHDFLRQRSGSVDEYELIEHLNQFEFFAPIAQFSQSLKLFYKHFLTMHVLYRLQQQVAASGGALTVGPLQIELTECSNAEPAATAPAVAEQALRDYYLDLTHLESATESGVADLLTSFWKRFESWRSSPDDHAVLGVGPEASWLEVQQAYRRQVQQAHPDKGGDAAEFARLQNAFNNIKRRNGR